MESKRQSPSVSARLGIVAIACLALGAVVGWAIGHRGSTSGGSPAPIYFASPPSTRPAAQPRAPSIRRLEEPLVDHVVLISIDGLRPDVLLRAKAPAIRALMAESSFTLWAQTVEAPHVYTLPSHTTMLTGVSPERHGVMGNDAAEPHPKVPTIFERAKAAKTDGGPLLTTAMVSGKTKFAILSSPGSLDWSFIPPVDQPTSDLLVSREAVRILREHRPNLTFVHLPDVDLAGHEFGWGSAEQMQAAERADAALGEVLSAVAQLNLQPSTLVIVTADHGGAGLTHGGDDPRSRIIPWMARGPVVRRGVDLTLDPGIEVRTEDTFATICVALGIPLPADTEGRFVVEMIEPLLGQELLRNWPTSAPR